MSTFSLYPTATAGADSNFTDSSSATMSDISVISDDWTNLAQQIFSLDGNSTSIIDVFCDAWVGGSSSTDVLAAQPTISTAIWDHAVTKTIGWTIVMLLKSILFEQRFDRWSGSYRFLNLGTTLVPFAMAAWTMYEAAMDSVGDIEETGGSITWSSMTIIMIVMNLCKIIVVTPVIRNWILIGLASVLLNHILFGKIRSSKTFALFSSIPGVLAIIITLACWVTDETIVASKLLGSAKPDILLLQAKLLRWTANTVSSWYCYAWTIKRIFGTSRFTSFSCFLLVVFLGKILTTREFMF